MKKRLKGLVSLWLTAVMVCTMLVTPALAAEIQVWLYTGSKALVVPEGGLSPDESLPATSITISTDAALNSQNAVQDALVKPDNNTVLTGWNIWNAVSGNIYTADEVSADLIISEYGIETNSVLEPIWHSKYKINPQPTGDTPTVGVEVYTIENDTWVWSVVSDSADLTYQWFDSTNSPVDGQTDATLTAETDGEYYCKVTIVSESIELTSNRVVYTAPVPEPDATDVFIGSAELGTGIYYNYDNGTLSVGSADDYNIYMTGSADEGYVLTINDLTVSGAGSMVLCSASSDLTLVLEGTNTLTAADSNTLISCGVYAAKDLIITGSGALTANGGMSPTSSAGIFSGGNITIGNGNITAIAGTAAAHSVGIGTRGTGGDITINGGSVSATGGTAMGGSSYGIGAYGNSGKVTITGGTVTANGGSAVGGSSYGIGATGGVNISGLSTVVNASSYDESPAEGASVRTLSRSAVSAVNALGINPADTRVSLMASQDTGNNFGIGTNGSLLITGGTVTANGGANRDGNSFGIGCDSSISITGGIVSAESGTSASHNSVGILSYGSITLNGNASVTSIGNNAGLASCGIVSGSNVSISGNANVSAIGGDANGPGADPTDPSNTRGNSYGIGAVGQIFIEDNASVTAASGDSANGSCYGVGGVGGITMSGNASLRATGGNALNGRSHGIGSTGDIYFYDTVTVNASAGAASNTYGSVGCGTVGSVFISQTASVTATGEDWNIGAEGGVSNIPGSIPPVYDLPVFVPPATGSGIHTCNSACEVCGGCEDPECTKEACADKCVLLTMYFPDVKSGQWYSEAVLYVAHRGLMGDAGNGLFDLSGTTSRAMLVTILWRLEGAPVVNYAMGFEDIAPDTWYTEAVRWASACGIVDGYSADRFAPAQFITREQMATILWRYAKYKGYDVSVGEDTNILSYTDAFDVKAYAIPAMQWACGAGIIGGSNGALMPQGDATRAQVATILMRFCESIAN